MIKSQGHKVGVGNSGGSNSGGPEREDEEGAVVVYRADTVGHRRLGQVHPPACGDWFIIKETLFWLPCFHSLC